MIGASASRRGLVAAAYFAFAASACSVVPEGEPPPNLYNLTPLAAGTVAADPTPAAFVVELPNAGGGLDTNKIAVRETPIRLQYYADARWVERAPEMLQTLIITSMRNAGGTSAVARRSLSIDPDYRLRTELEAFEAVYPDGSDVPAAHIRIHAALLEQPSQRAVATREFAARSDAASPTVPDVIRAFNAAADDVLRDLVAWTLASAAAPAERGPGRDSVRSTPSPPS